MLPKVREPASVWDVEAATGLKAEKLIGELGSCAHPHQALRTIDRQILNSRDGSGLHFYFPLTRMKYIGEFLKGALSILAPRARITLLKTPYHEELCRHSAQLQRNLAACQSPEDRRHIVIDCCSSGATIGAIRRILGRSVEFVDPRDFHAGFTEQFSHLDKTKDGRMAMGSGYLLDFLLQHPQVNPQEGFRNGCYVLEDRFVGDPDRYFTQAELSDLKNEDGVPVKSLRGLKPAGRGRRIIDFIRLLSEDRQRAIVNRLNREDARFSKAIFMLGKAAAKDYRAAKTGTAAADDC